jgi:hypothetical protein
MIPSRKKMIPRITAKRFITQNITTVGPFVNVGVFFDTPLRLIGEGELQTSKAERETNYARPAAAVAAALAAAAFLAALAAVEALRRRLVFGGVAGASPMSSATMMLVTNNLGP